MFIEIDRIFLKSISSGSERIPKFYFSENTLMYKIFWMRLKLLYVLIRKFSHAGKCLDFGGGGGVFLPSLSRTFQQVVCVDLVTEEAEKVVRNFGLKNVVLVKGDISDVSIQQAPFDVIVAADVLEHFPDLSIPVSSLKCWLSQAGTLFTSLPTESWLYVLLRKCFGVEKPKDHYHTAREVEDFLERNGFVRIHRRFVPLHIGIFPLFSVCAWKNQGSRQ